MDSVHNFVQDLLEVLVFLTVLATLGASLKKTYETCDES